MPGTILENLSGRKLSVLVTILLICNLASFLIGFIAPSPATSEPILTTVCVDADPENDKIDRTFTLDCKHKILELGNEQATIGLDARNLVFVAQMPRGKLDFSRWQQNMIGILDVITNHQENQKILDPRVELTIDARLYYSNKSPAGRDPWKLYAYSEEKRYMDCELEVKSKDSPYTCTMVPLFELGNLYHDFYLLNIRLPYNASAHKNTQVGKITEINLHVIHMNGGFTRIWITLKTIFLPIIVSIMIWFWRRVHKLNRTPALLEYMLMSLGGTLAFLDLPIELLSIYFDTPFMLLLTDIRQGVFYAMLLSFWLVFAGEHMLIQDNGAKNYLKMYWKHLSTIAIGCLNLLVFDLCERGVQLLNPFYSIWVTPIGTNLALSFIILAGISASMYFLFLCYMIWKVFKNISIKRAVLPNMSQARRLHYEGIIYRFNFLMLATLICAAVTVISFILSQVSEGHNKWDENLDIEMASAAHTGVFGMWNVYICAMLILYAPSHKQWPSESLIVEGEEVEFNNLPSEGASNEITSLTSFASKSNIE